jgi:hypothetical protein
MPRRNQRNTTSTLTRPGHARGVHDYGHPFVRQEAAQPDPGESLRDALRELGRAIVTLTGERVEYVNGKVITAAAIVAELEDSVAGTQGTGRGGVARSIPNVWVDAVDLLNEMDTALRAWRLAALHIQLERPPETTVARIHALGDRQWTPDDVDRLRQITRVLTEWAHGIENLLNPPRRWSISATCPACGETTTYRTDGGGDRVRVPVLAVSAAGCTCLACETSWGPQRFAHLALVLGETPANVLE